MDVKWIFEQYSASRSRSQYKQRMHSLSFFKLNRKWNMRMHLNKRERDKVGLFVTLHGQLLENSKMLVGFSFSLLSQQGESLTQCDFKSDFSDGKGHGDILITKG